MWLTKCKSEMHNVLHTGCTACAWRYHCWRMFGRTFTAARTFTQQQLSGVVTSGKGSSLLNVAFTPRSVLRNSVRYYIIFVLFRSTPKAEDEFYRISVAQTKRVTCFLLCQCALRNMSERRRPSTPSTVYHNADKYFITWTWAGTWLTGICRHLKDF